MEMIDASKIESEKEVEARAREKVNATAVVKSALLVGVIVMVVPSGGPWMSTEAFLNVMGRVVTESFLVNVVGQLLLAFFYGWVVASCVYRFRFFEALPLAAALAVPLWGFSFLLFSLVGGFTANELHTFIAHFEFCVFFTAAYKAWSVPRPRRKKA